MTKLQIIAEYYLSKTVVEQKKEPDSLRWAEK